MPWIRAHGIPRRNKNCFGTQRLHQTTPQPASQVDANNLRSVLIVTDGGWLPVKGHGAWAAIVIEGKNQIELTGSEKLTSNNRMEIMGCIAGLEHLKERCAVSVVSDSKYLLNGAKVWLPLWVRRGWRTVKGQPVKNQDLWLRLQSAMSVHSIQWNWVKGHAGNPLNSRADELCSIVLRQIGMAAA